MFTITQFLDNLFNAKTCFKPRLDTSYMWDNYCLKCMKYFWSLDKVNHLYVGI